MGNVALSRLAAALAAPALLWCAVPTMRLEDIKPGMRGVGKTVFQGNRIDEFQVEILGTLENVGPKQSVILARLSGGPLDRTGVMQGMSGSPVYIDGKLAGAVAMTFAFSKEPIAGIRPIGEMFEVEKSPPKTELRPTAAIREPINLLTRPEDVLSGEGRLTEIATPVSFGGFTRATLDHFAPQLRSVGLEPLQGLTGGGAPASGFGDPSLIQPGSMISVQLLSGDMSIGAEGTVTSVDGSRVYGFGHRFLSVGPTEMPFARAEVIALLPNLSTSFKISASREWMGAITQDRSAGIAGILGRRADMVPFTISVSGPESTAGRTMNYRMQMVNDRVLAPLLVQIALYSAIDATERTMGVSSLEVRGHISFQGAVPPIELNNVYTGDVNVPLQASLNTAVPLAYLMQSGFDALKLKEIAIDVRSFDRKKQYQIDQAWTSVREARPGDDLDVIVTMCGENSVEMTRKAKYHIPVGAPPGPLYITVADGATTNLTEYQQLLTAAPKTPAQFVRFLNEMRPNNKAYIRIWRADASYTVEGEDLPDPPPSIAMLLAKTHGSLGGSQTWRGSSVAEIAIDAGDAVVSGSRTIQVDIKE